ncbi:Pyrimidine 5'-nucleotidase [Ancylostoma ceylanicum]|uniref:5'-nucleotidase n=1 Tax=Ancylostoma ceylanicum TaxID=53326 RepID=A0A0D6M9A2_9BILA|nr:Pyrimidine 5'-nucleotidase [Ancylostoma ceylanicum]
METEVIVLDSDDDDSPANAPVNGSALASIAIVNSKPLDLDALANRIKSSTGVPYLQTITPIAPAPQRQRLSYEKTRSQPPCEDFGINAISLLGNTASPRPLQPRPTTQMHSRPANVSPSFRPAPRLVPESRVQNYNFEVNGEKSTDSDRQLCPSLKFKVGTASALRTHLLAHEPNDAPYHCKRCRYRCTVRMHLFDHFVREHKNTSTLMCPFCTFTIVVPSYQRKRPVIRASEFVYHMISHEAEARLGCDHCALSFSTLSEKQKHRKEHTAVNPKWTLTYRNPETRTRPRSRLVCPEQKPLYQCSKCACSSETGTSHKKCISCVTLAFNESLYGKRRAATDTSLRRGIDSLQCSTRGMRFRCKCGLSTRNGNRMALHYYYCHKDFDVVETDDELGDQSETDEAEDKQEAQLFSVLHKVEPVVKAREKTVERKRKFLEPPLMIFEQQMNSMSKPEDMNNAVVFFLRIVMVVEKILNHPSVRVRDRSAVVEKLNAILKGGNEQLAVISDFDFTLTKSIDEKGERCLGSHAVVNHLLLSLHPELAAEVNAVNAKYVAIEYDPHLTKEEKMPYMVEWWTKAHENYITHGIHRDDIERIVEEGRVNACSEPLIHVFCKDSSVIPHDAPFFDDIAHRGNVLLLGDSLGDIHMDVGVDHSGTVLRIGYLNSNAEKLLELYLDGFDIVLVEDQTTDVPDLILQALVKQC